MSFRYLPILALPLLAGADATDAASKADLKKLEGTWVMTAVEWEGEGPAEQDVTTDARRELVIRGNKYTDGQVGANFKKAQGFIRLDAAKAPKAMDFSRSEEFKDGETSLLIYELDGDTLKTAAGKKNRPASFKIAPTSGVIVVYWKRTE